jgi:hypothetical protein
MEFLILCYIGTFGAVAGAGKTWPACHVPVRFTFARVGAGIDPRKYLQLAFLLKFIRE